MGVSGQRHAPAALLPPGKGPPVPIGQEAGWASEPVWTQRIEEKSFAHTGNRTPIARLARSQTLYCLSYPGSLLLRLLLSFNNNNNKFYTEKVQKQGNLSLKLQSSISSRKALLQPAGFSFTD
jgi:hypothetical protein